MKISRLKTEEVISLRHSVLRSHQPISEAYYPTDNDPLTAHIGAYDGSHLVGVGTIFAEDEPSSEENGWRIRGMAVLDTARGKGVGKIILDACLEHARNHGGRYVWCNARTPACGFYGKCGFHPLGEEFEIEGIGPHYIMTIDIS